MPHTSAFVSYRREDSLAAARSLRDELENAFGARSVFMDESVQPGDAWPDRIRYSLTQSTVTLAVIGPTWLRVSDEYGRRKIDKDDDWVRQEIESSLSKVLIPVLVGHATLPPPHALPVSISALVSRQAIELRDSKWGRDISELISQLEIIGFVRIQPRHLYPVLPCNPGKHALSETELEDSLRSLTGWRRSTRRQLNDGARIIDELSKTFEFNTFDEAMSFMKVSAEYISVFNHHPRWENTWRTVTIWLTTWDLGHKISSLDVRLAEYFNKLYETFTSPEAGSAE